MHRIAHKKRRATFICWTQRTSVRQAVLLMVSLTVSQNNFIPLQVGFEGKRSWGTIKKKRKLFLGYSLVWYQSSFMSPFEELPEDRSIATIRYRNVNLFPFQLGSDRKVAFLNRVT